MSALKNDRVYNVLFLCTGNTARSILAESILRKEGAGRFQAFSAGSQPKGVVNPFALKVLTSFNYPTDAMSSKKLGRVCSARCAENGFCLHSLRQRRRRDLPLLARSTHDGALGNRRSCCRRRNGYPEGGCFRDRLSVHEKPRPGVHQPSAQIDRPTLVDEPSQRDRNDGWHLVHHLASSVKWAATTAGWGNNANVRSQAAAGC